MPMRMRERFARVLPFSARGEKARAHNELAMATDAADTAAIAAFLGGVYLRECNSMTTSLRQVHTVAGVSQSMALRLAKRLNEDGLIVIISALHDEFESRIELTEIAKRRLARLTHNNTTSSIPK